ncbi:DNA repair protein [Haemophilus parahaemolyticus]|uniref:DNA repair protein n=1 Tax=Haemophilus parahaemolyticus TaxID=735 RepID=UPI0028D2B041|nr:DNA repair protein [Haemophilus parahaemolyticus]
MQLLHHTAEEALSNANEYNTELYTYRTYKRRFNGKLRQLLLMELKSEPHRYFTVNGLIKRMLVKYGQEPIIHQQHTVSIRAALKYWFDKGVVERLEINVVDVK